MDWNAIINEALKLVIMVVCGLISAYVIPWLDAKKKETKSNAEANGYLMVYEMIDRFVASAEQLAINEGYGPVWKKQYVVNLLEKSCGVKVDDELDAYIESAVILLHNTLYGIEA